MSNPRPHLPPEILDHIIDLLHDNRETLLQCCLVSKSRIPRARKYLFAHVEFKSEGYDKWKKTFPDPTNSLAHHVYTLTVDGSLRGAEDSSWIRGFARVERLIVDGEWAGSNVTSISFVPFHRSSISFVPPPLLQDLALSGDDIIVDKDESGEPPAAVPSTPLALTGTLDLFLCANIGRILRQLLCLPSGLHFRKLDMSRCRAEDLHQAVKIVAACPSTLEYLKITCQVDDDDTPAPIDLHKATKLREVVFRWGSLTHECGWVLTSLKTTTVNHRDLQQISIQVPCPSGQGRHRRAIIERGESLRPGMWWSDLDNLQVKFRKSRSINLRVACPWTRDKMKARGWALYLLPKATKRGAVIVPFDEPSC